MRGSIDDLLGDLIAESVAVVLGLRLLGRGDVARRAGCSGSTCGASVFGRWPKAIGHFDREGLACQGERILLHPC